jgi:hypothetical protein
MLSRYMEVSPLQQEQPSSEERMQQKNISSQPSLLGRQHKSHSILPCCLWPVIEFLARPVLFSRQEREPTQHAAWKQTTSTFQETTSLHQLQKRKEQVMPPPWLPHSHFPPLLHQGAPHPALCKHHQQSENYCCVHISSPKQSNDYCSEHSSSGTTPQPATTNRSNKKAGQALPLSITCTNDNRPRKREVQLHLSKYEHTQVSRCAKI